MKKFLKKIALYAIKELASNADTGSGHYFEDQENVELSLKIKDSFEFDKPESESGKGYVVKFIDKNKREFKYIGDHKIEFQGFNTIKATVFHTIYRSEPETRLKDLVIIDENGSFTIINNEIKKPKVEVVAPKEEVKSNVPMYVGGHFFKDGAEVVFEAKLIGLKRLPKKNHYRLQLADRYNRKFICFRYYEDNNVVFKALRKRDFVKIVSIVQNNYYNDTPETKLKTLKLEGETTDESKK